VGDSIQKFGEGDLVIIGENVPHVWRSENTFSKKKINESEALVIHFYKDISKQLFQIPEFSHINNFLERAKRGIVFNDPSHYIIRNELEKLPTLQPFFQFISLLKVLNMMDSINGCEFLTSEEYEIDLKKKKNLRLEKIIRFIMENFYNEISLSQVAEIASLSRTAFCRYFKLHTGLNFKEYVNIIRVRYAARLLSGGDFNITEACFRSGFNSLSYFDRTFRRIIHYSPSKYKAEYSFIRKNQSNSD
jgi:AraC-like DNA-binding protein